MWRDLGSQQMTKLKTPTRLISNSNKYILSARYSGYCSFFADISKEIIILTRYNLINLISSAVDIARIWTDSDYK